MDTGSGHIYEMDKVDIKNIKGKLVPWKVGEEVVIKECKFKVKEIRTIPADEIVLVGMPNDDFAELLETNEKIKEESPHKILDFVRKKK